jgi:hypothetical protein
MLEPDTDAIRGAVIVMRRADRDTRNAVKRETRARLIPRWRALVERKVTDDRDRQVYLRARPSVSLNNNGGKLVAAQGGRRLAGGLLPYRDYAMVEFGSGGPYARRGQLPATRGRSGRIAYPAITSWAPTAARTWLRALADTIRDTGLAEDDRG